MEQAPETALPSADDILRLFYDLPFIGMAVTSPATKRWLRVNQALCDILGYPHDELVRKSWAQVTHPDDLDADVAEFDRVMRGETDGYKMDKRFIRKDGAVVYATIDVRSIRGAGGGVDFFVATVADVTSQRLTLDALQRSKARLKESQRLARLGSWELDLGRGELVWSDEVYRIFEMDPARFGASYEAFLALVHPEDRARVDEAYRSSLRDRQPYRISHRLRMPDGRVKHVEERCETDFDAQGRALLSRGTVQDITDRVAAEVERERLIGELEQRNAELERFTYTVSHDLRSPLITIRGFASSLRRDLDRGDTERLDDDLGRIEGAVARMEALLSDLLRLSRVGHAAGPPETVGLTDAARDAVALVAGAIGESGAEVVLPPDLPAVHADRGRLVELLQNLIENAAKYRQPGRPLRVEVGAVTEHGQVAAFVQDNGIGIDPRYHERVFGLFDKLDSKSDGTGVGLAVARRIVEVHGGRLWVESGGAGEGATFRFTLPAAPSPPEGAAR